VLLLRTIPGVGPRTAEAVVAYVDDPHRFGSTRRVGTYFGLVPCQDQSAKVNRLGHITREGPATVRKLLVEACWQVIRHSPRMKKVFERIKDGRKDRTGLALVATARHLVTAMVAMLKSGEAWRKEEPAALEQKQAA
jgi:transposase